MNKGTLAIVGGIVLVVALGVTLLQPAPEPEAVPEPPPPRDQAVIDEAMKNVDVAGLPPLFPDGKEHPKSAISISEYFEKYGPVQLVDPETRKVRPELAAALQGELAGKQVTWDAYVHQVNELPSGRTTLVVKARPDALNIEVAMIKYSAAESERIQSFGQGDRVRVVAVYDKLQTMFPSLRGMEIERTGQTGLESSTSLESRRD